MMTTIKTTLAALALMALPMTMCAQDKLFTLEDLNFGGKNYHNMQPKNMWLTWWGDQLIQTDVEECYTIDAKTKTLTLYSEEFVGPAKLTLVKENELSMPDQNTGGKLTLYRVDE